MTELHEKRHKVRKVIPPLPPQPPGLPGSCCGPSMRILKGTSGEGFNWISPGHKEMHIEVMDDGSVRTTSHGTCQSIEDGNLEILIPLPGIDKSSLQVRAKAFKLSVSANRLDQYVGKMGGEKTETVIKLAEEVNPDAATAKYRDGILMITMPLANPGHDVDIEE